MIFLNFKKCLYLQIFRISFILLIVLCAVPDLAGQEISSKEKAPWSFGVNSYYGALFRYRSGTNVLNFTHPFGIELYANRHTTGKRLWERKFNYPLIGFALSYYNYGMPDELGEAYSLTTYLDNNLIKGKKGSLRFNLGTGIVYSTRHYTPVTNELNKAIGSKFCFVLRSTFRYEFNLREDLFFNLNLAFRHFSNGGLNKPNNGMNFPLLGAGLRYQPRPVKRVHGMDILTRFDRNIHFTIKFSAGRKEVLRIDEKHPVYSVSLYASKRLSPVNALLVGADAFYDTALRNEFINKHLSPPEGEMDPRMGGITIGHELYLGKLSFIVQVGRYLYKPYDEIFPDYYQRYGFKYLITKNISASAMLMAHTKTANVIEWGLGFHL